MIVESLLGLFSLFSMFFLALGMTQRSPVVTIAGGIILILLGGSLMTGGIIQYDGTKNQTLTYHYTNSSNISVQNIEMNVTGANWRVIQGADTLGWSLMSVLAGLASAIYGLTMRPKASVEAVED